MLNRWRKVPVFPFLVAYHILSETEIYPFLRLLRMNSSEMQYRDQLNSEWKNWIGCCYRPNTVIDVRVLRVSTFATELDLTVKVKARGFIIETLRFFVFERTKHQPRRNVSSYLVLQRLCNEAALSPGIDAFLY